MTARFAWFLLLLVAPAALAQLNPPRFEIGPFGGVSRYWAHQDAPNKAGWVDGGLAGFRFTGNLNDRVALEFAGSTYGVNNVRTPLTNATPVPRVAFGSRTYEAWAGLVFYFARLEHRWTPFVKAGPAVTWWAPTDEAKRSYNFAPYNLSPHMSMEPGAQVGVGLKGYFSRHVGVRFDLDGIYSGQPHYKLPGIPNQPGNAYIPSNGGLLGVQLTAELFFGIGRLKETPIAAAPPPPPPPPPPEPTLDITWPEMRTVDAGCPGDAAQPIEVAVNARTNLPGHNPSYKWTVDGSPAGDDSPNFRLTVPPQSGEHTVGVTVSDNAAGSSDTRTAAPQTRQVLVADVRSYQPPTITGSVNPTEVTRGSSATLSLTPKGSPCGGQVTYTCQPSDGAVSGTPPAQFDSSNVAFDADRSKPQSKTVNIACNVADAKGGTGSVSLSVVVNLPAELSARRFDDVVFPANNSRVNNCGKRILLEEVARELAEHPDWDLVIVGHSAEGERSPKGGSSLDRERVLNVVATLTAGTDTCGQVDVTRIKVAYAGTTQKSEPRPAFCGTSTRPAANERAGQTVAAADAKASGRRVEIYVVPKGGSLPNAADNYEVVPKDVVAPRGCPK
jgi:outer membrane protein OmpA-like peptidoglycan-associated protein